MKVFSIIIAIIAAIVIICLIAWSRAPDMLANSLSKKMKVPVRIQDVSFSMDSITIDNFEIGNPSGFNLLPRAFSAEKIDILAPVKRYFYEHIVIDQISIDNIYLGLEFDKKGSKKGNWTVIAKNMQGAKKSENPKKGKDVLIKVLILNNINISLAFDKEGTVQQLKPVKRLVLRDVSSEKGIPTEEISNIIMKQMLESIFKGENLQNMIDGILNEPDTLPQKLIQPFKGLFNARKGEESDCA